MTRNTDSTTRRENHHKIIRVTRQEQLERVVRAANYMVEHDILATRSNTASVAKRFWIRPKLLEQAMRILAEEDFSE